MAAPGSRRGTNGFDSEAIGYFLDFLRSGHILGVEQPSRHV